MLAPELNLKCIVFHAYVSKSMWCKSDTSATHVCVGCMLHLLLQSCTVWPSLPGDGQITGQISVPQCNNLLHHLASAAQPAEITRIPTWFMTQKAQVANSQYCLLFQCMSALAECHSKQVVQMLLHRAV